MLMVGLRLNSIRSKRIRTNPNIFDNYVKFTRIDEDGAFIGVPSFTFKLGYNYGIDMNAEGAYISNPSFNIKHGKLWETSWLSDEKSAHITVPETIFHFEPIPEVRS